MLFLILFSDCTRIISLDTAKWNTAVVMQTVSIHVHV